jgi:hypothetical protein
LDDKAKNSSRKIMANRNEKGCTMRHAHVKNVPLGAIMFVLVMMSGVFPSLAQAIDLTINYVGTGTGRVAGSDVPGTGPFFIFESRTINYELNEPPSSVVLTATPTSFGPSKSTFDGWTGCNSTSGDQCTVLLNSDKTVTVAFNLQPVVLTINFTGSGTGKVDGSQGPSGSSFTIFSTITNPGVLIYNPPPSSSVILTATPTTLGASQSTFASWSGCASISGTQCTVDMSADRTVTVTFNLVVQRTLTVTKAGTGSGTVTSAPAGISCGGDCTQAYTDGTNVTLTAAASAGSTFAGWSGGAGTCSGTTSPCSLPMTATRTVTATFTQNAGNQAPSVNAGTDQTITLPNTAPLSGTVTDDGLPASPGEVTITWSKVSGPGTVTFANPSAASTTATFSQAGVYVLRLTATDGALSRSSDLTVTVANPGARKLSNDLNADGTADLLWRSNQSGVVVAWLMNNAAIATSGVLAGVPPEWKIMGMGDVDADGHADVVWRNTSTGVVAVWLMNGLSITKVGFPGSASLSLEIKGIGDMDGNGTADIVWRDNKSGAVAIWLLDGTAITFSGFPGTVPLEWEIAGLGDVDADDKADIIWRNSTNGVVAVWLMNGLTRTSVGFPGAASVSYVIKKIGDTDGNGTADIVWQDTLSGVVAVWLMDGTTVAFAGFPGGVAPEWDITGMGDVNADGQADLIWQNRANGVVAVWLMNGKDRVGTAFPRGTSTDWEIQ